MILSEHARIVEGLTRENLIVVAAGIHWLKNEGLQMHVSISRQSRIIILLELAQKLLLL